MTAQGILNGAREAAEAHGLRELGFAVSEKMDGSILLRVMRGRRFHDIRFAPALMDQGKAAIAYTLLSGLRVVKRWPKPALVRSGAVRAWRLA